MQSRLVNNAACHRLTAGALCLLRANSLPPLPQHTHTLTHTPKPPECAPPARHRSITCPRYGGRLLRWRLSDLYSSFVAETGNSGFDFKIPGRLFFFCLFFKYVLIGMLSSENWCFVDDKATVDTEQQENDGHFVRYW